ncbi:MAG: hypothetical protein WA461_05060 [Nitrososphaeraceae archaeon]
MIAVQQDSIELSYIRIFSLTVFDNPIRENASKLSEIITSHPSKAANPQLVRGSTDSVAVHLVYTDETDLLTNLRNIKESVRDTTIASHAPYTAFFSLPA